ncbi:iron-containing alcohol dehydrogenase [candidate division KSB1 bacterium]|nr:iron-containing alcohol dehydrogenase [candidate division KSB1 bacterium]NIR69155.1 iron-containing alcohol dehydrogenase [candidate division KSB1 bacterium]NIS25666.1 iron-containing alcohol dehydrogenase [candidate division KSB1 bacterium]NIT72534.1 iron-containing alcohol dehydrogenase [candidate division KSB1 bacterium]NIU26343.1 iron-containing alcohol dehydrogenase [candidate division KSB1 bacterium]
MHFDYKPTTRVIFGENSLDRLGELTLELGARRALIVTDPGIIAVGHIERAERSLREASIEPIVFKDVEENPTTRHVESGVRFAKAHEPIDVIIGIGGGSAMDCAKGINFIFTNGGKMEDYWGIGKATKPMLLSIGVPTTAGTGSEAQSFALIAQEETHRKMACGDKKARFRTVILDPVLVKSVPKEVAAITGMDAISHAVESFVSSKRNAISQMFSKEAWRLLAANYEIVLSEPENVRAWGQMQLGAHFAGTAIENSMLGAAHACANPLTAHYGITHGIAVGLMLPHVVRFNGQVVNGHYDELLSSARLSDKGHGAEQLAETIFELKNAGGLPARLRDFEIHENELPQLAREAVEQWTGKFNPRSVNEAELLELYKLAY